MKKIKLGDVGKIFNGSTIPKSEGKFPAYGGNGIIKNVSDFNFEGNVIAVGRVGAQCGVVHFCKKKCWITDNCLCFKPNENFNSYYVYHLLKFLNLNQFHIGSAQPLITQSIINEIILDFIPPLEIQKKIGNFLYSLDEKISLNKKINATLEEMAKTIYDYYFVQFDFPDENGKPYKSSGGKMIFSPELQREIPEGWEVKKLSDLLIKNSIPFDYKTTEPTIDLSVMPSNSISLDKLNSSDNFSTNLFKMSEGDILFGSIRPYLKKAGIAPCNGVVAGTIHSYKTKNNFDYNFSLITLCNDNFFDYAVKISTGTKMPVVSNENILEFKVAYSEKIIKMFNSIDLRKIICKNNLENNLLERLRDFLLPLLMNGQVGFKEKI